MIRHLLGVCPNCGSAVPECHLLIEYETCKDPAVFAECPDCGDVVHPEGPPPDHKRVTRS